jgi:hypothetical protein
MPSKKSLFRPWRAKKKILGVVKPPPNPHRVTRVNHRTVKVKYRTRIFDLARAAGLKPSAISTKPSTQRVPGGLE